MHSSDHAFRERVSTLNGSMRNSERTRAASLALLRTDSAPKRGTVDRLAEWLLTNCPFSTLTILALLVVGFAVSIPRIPVIVAAVIAADVLLNLGRWHRRRSHVRRAAAVIA